MAARTERKELRFLTSTLVPYSRAPRGRTEMFGLAAHRPLLHVTCRGPEVAHQLPDLLQVGVGLCRGA